jgi:hypothetical protein
MVRHQYPLFLIAVSGSAVLVVDLVFIVVLWMNLNLGVDLGSWSEDSNPACNVSGYNASEILFEGNAQYPPRTVYRGVTQLTGEEVGNGGYVAHWCNQVQWWFNIAIKYTSYYFLCTPNRHSN